MNRMRALATTGTAIAVAETKKPSRLALRNERVRGKA
jgi:hypothetical protein